MSVIRILSVVSLAILAGCNMFNRDTPRSQQLGAEAFYRPVPGAEDRHDKSADRSGAIRDAYLTPAPAEAGVPAARAQALGPRNPPTIPLDPENRTIPPASTTQPGESAVAIAATLPPLQPGQFQLVGAVVVDVSGTPIYADKVLQDLTPDLSAKAKEMSVNQFGVYASKQIQDWVGGLIQSELLFRQANKELSAEDKERANLATMNWRDLQVRRAGGSIELARRKAAAEGQSLEEAVQDYYRRVMVELFRLKRVNPRVPITVDEMSRYYEMNKATEFSVSDAAQFRVIKIMVSRTPGDTLDKRRSNAQDKIKQLREQVVDRSDEDFAKVASQVNDDQVLMKNGGRLTEDGWMKKGEYAVSKVEEDLWKLQPGQVTDVIPVGDSYYIARLSDRKIGHTLSFDDAEVQLRIVDALRRPRVDALQQQELKKLRDDAVVYPDRPRYDVVLSMVMQKYPIWAAGGK